MEINQSSGARSLQLLGDDAAVLAPSSGEERHRHAIELAAHRWRGGRRGDSGRTRRKILISHRQELRELLDLAVDAGSVTTPPRGEISFSLAQREADAPRQHADVPRIHPPLRRLDRVVQFRRREAALLYKTGMCGRGRGVGIWQPLRSIEMKSPVTKSWMRSILNLSPGPPPAPKRCVLFMVCYLGSSPAAPPLRSALLRRACGVASR